ncbi:hypothetical protein DFR86_00690 [Acidianus sulfidivorans JP7]|uniref:AAA+ ATPase domain-containing protein n=1 Tax=Acidianus sulfidivorans JP7 TaxID=619593 RepID=A0A2U9IJI0_9CREN|nr:ATP-binding protein [Acidianus sulfidivorans]AWR96208.1 hypothetical protein DFR86_00690 [Acidianus sulfidivorans JP7]
MNCNFSTYPVAKYDETENISLAGSIWKNAVKKIESSIVSGGGSVITIVGEPGMGKTTILNKVKKDLSLMNNGDNIFVIFLDLTNSKNISSEAWYYIKNSSIREKISNVSFNFLNSHRKEIGYRNSIFNREFSNWLKHRCIEEKKREEGRIRGIRRNSLDNNYSYALRLYCMSSYDVNEYDETNEGFILFLNDLRNLGKVGVFLDEMKDSEDQLRELHELINKVKNDITLVVSLVPEVLNGIKDKALNRRLTEINENLFNLTLNEKDKQDILEAYCKDFSDSLIQVDEVRNSKSVSDLINVARDAYEFAKTKCSNDENIEKCIKDEIMKSFSIPDPNEASKELEKKIREGLKKLKEEFGIEYVHDRGKRIPEKDMIIDIFFLKGKVEYLGDIKLTNKETVENIENVRKLENFSKDGEYNVVKFIISNSDNINLTNFKIIKVDNRQIIKILNGDSDERDNLVKHILKEVLKQ